MRRIIYIIIAIACLLLLFNITDVTVIDKSLKLPVSGASVNNFKTIDTGVAKFLDFSFDQFITVERIGYQTTKVKLSYRPVYRKITVEIDEADVSSSSSLEKLTFPRHSPYVLRTTRKRKRK